MDNVQKGRVLSREALANVIENQQAEIESLRAQLAAQPTPSQSEPVALMDSVGVCAITLHMVKELESRGNTFPYDAWPTELYTEPQPTSQEVVDAVLAEREACAKICLDHSAEFNDPFPLVRASNCILARNERE